MKNRICFIAQFPPPIHGLSKAVDTLYNSVLSEEFDFEKVNINNNRAIVKNLLKIIRSKADLYYFTISQSKGGNLRDLVILKLIQIKHKKSVIHLHGGYYRELVENNLPTWQKTVNYKMINKVSGAIVLGPSLKSIFKDMVPDSRVYVVPNCVDDAYLMSDEDFEKKRNTKKEYRIKHVLYLSNFIKTKGYREVLKMAAIEKDRVCRGGTKLFHFDFAGGFFEKEEEEFFKSFIKDNALDEYVSYHGVVGGEKKLDLLKQCDFFTLLTSYPKEGQPISILEAMGNGAAIITTNHAGIPDIVEDGENGTVLQKNDPDIAEKAYMFMLENINSDMGLCCRKKVLSAFRERNYIDNMRNAFNSVLGLN